MDHESLLETFREEVLELLEQLEKNILLIEKAPENPELTDSILRVLHTIKGTSNMFGFEGIVTLTHEIETLISRLREKQSGLSSKITDLVLSSCDFIRISLQDKTYTNPALLDAVQAEILALNGQGQTDEKNVVRKKNTVVQEQAAIQQKTIRVNYQKINELSNLVGELITLKTKYAQLSLEIENDELKTMNEQLDILLARLHKTTMNIRMVPLGQLFEHFNRLTRDLAHSLNKQVELVIRGSDTELDKNVTEELSDPMLHMIRNAIDHGIEKPEERRQAGKPETGKIILAAEHAGAYVHIKLIDDGAGLDLAQIRKTAIAKGLLAKEEELSPGLLNSIIFSPGFSTSDKITDISGRGIGMNVVKKNIEKIKGTIELKTEKGRGTEILLKIPLTLAIVDGLLLRAGGETFIIDVEKIVECYDMEEKMILRSSKADMIRIADESIPFIKLKALFRIPGGEGNNEQLIVVRYDNKKIGILVDSIIGKQKIVIKPIGNLFNSVSEVSGATILGDGTIALILDVQQIFKKLNRKDEKFQAKEKPTPVSRELGIEQGVTG